MDTSPAPIPLRAPDVGRMADIEQQLAEIEPRLRELTARVEAARGLRDAAKRRLDDLDHDRPIDTQLRAELATADARWRAAFEAWREADAPTFALRDEWLQLQVVKSFLPRCAVCEQVVGPSYLEVEPDDRRATLCLDCFDGWVCGYDPGSGQRRPSHSIEELARAARDCESERRCEVGPSTKGACWHCGDRVDDVVALRVTALVPAGTIPAVGDVCQPCLDWYSAVDGRWSQIARNLCEPARPRHQRAEYHWLLHGPGSRTRAADLPAARPPLGSLSECNSPSRGPAGRW